MRLTALLILLSYSFQSHAIFDILKGKNATTSTSRWTLADWLGQKSKMSLADQWLAANRSKTSFEFNPSAAHSRYSVRTEDPSTGTTASITRDSQIYRLDTNISIFNLTGEYEKSSDNVEEFGGALGLRLLGESSRSTSLVARYGWRRLQDLGTFEKWDNQYAEGQLQLYIISAFGLNGQYRHYFPATSNLGNRLEGSKLSAGAFLEFGIFRLFANYTLEPLTLKNGDADTVTKQKREGYDAGIKIHM